MFVGTERFIPEILEAHLEDAAFLWEQRERALRSSTLGLRALVDRDERLAAHTDGLVLAHPDALRWLLNGLTGAEWGATLAAAYVMLSVGEAGGVAAVIEAFTAATGARLEALTRALCYAPIGPVAPIVRRLASFGEAAVGCAAAEVLAFHGDDAATARLFDLVHDDDAGVRARAWSVLSHVGTRTAALPSWIPRALAQATAGDPDPRVRGQAFEAAAWLRDPNLLRRLRKTASAPTPAQLPAHALFSVLAGPEDLEAMRAIGMTAALGPERFDLLATFGHPQVIRDVIEEIENPDPVVSVAAAAAFARLSGVDVLPDGAAETLGSPSDEAPESSPVLPDVERARTWYVERQRELVKVERVSRGVPIDVSESREFLDRLDLRARFEGLLRLHYRGARCGSLADLTRFPQGVVSSRDPD